TPPNEWTVAGKSVAKVDARDFVTGRHKYTPDMTRSGMLHGKVMRPPSFGASLVSCDDSAAKSLPGVAIVRDGDFVAVAAPTEHQAQQALAALRPQWIAAPSQVSNANLFAKIKESASAKSDDRHREQQGSVETALAAARQRLDATYTVAFIAHAPLEPRAALAEWSRDDSGEKLTVWMGTQRPFAVRDELAATFRVPESSVRVIVPDTGSAYGGKHTSDAALEAARLARPPNPPAKVVWPRE